VRLDPTAAGAKPPDSRRIAVEPTPESIAAGVTALAAAHGTTGPSRSHPACRPTPPELDLGGPDTLLTDPARRRPDTDLEIRVPPALAAVYVVAPLAYYCCARLRTDAGTDPVLVDRDSGFRRDLGRLPELQDECAGLLRRVFYLDCVVRDVGGEAVEGGGEADRGDGIGATTPVSGIPPDPGDLGLDAERLGESGPAERLRRYLDLPAEAVDRHAPAWHLASYVAPRPDYVHCLSHLLDALSVVYLPRARPCGADDLLAHTLDGALATRGRATAAPRRLKPDVDDSRVHAWLAPGTPVGAFKATPGAFRHRRTLRSRPDRPTGSVSVVLADSGMAAEVEEAVAAYEAASVVTDLSLHTKATRAAVREAFDATADLVHYVGHCDPEGLRCRDGWLDPSNLDRVGAPAFVLNACGSYDVGIDLIEAGGVAGAVTVGDVLEGQAATVGPTLVRLLLRGFEVARATGLASRRILMGADYVAVGDGTYRAFDPRNGDPVVLRVRRDGDRFEVRFRGVTTDRTGHVIPLPASAPPTLNGGEVVRDCSRTDLLEVLEAAACPVIYDGDLHWPDDLVGTLDAETAT